MRLFSGQAKSLIEVSSKSHRSLIEVSSKQKSLMPTPRASCSRAVGSVFPSRGERVPEPWALTGIYDETCTWAPYVPSANGKALPL